MDRFQADDACDVTGHRYSTSGLGDAERDESVVSQCQDELSHQLGDEGVKNKTVS